MEREEKAKKKKRTNPKYQRVAVVFCLTVSLSAVLSLLSETALDGAGYAVALGVLAVFIGLGIVFDIIGVAVTAADPRPFHSMAAHREKGAKEALFLLRNASRVSSVCNDVVGDICGIVSGATGAVLVTLLQRAAGTGSIILSVGVTALISGLTIGGKALGKSFAMNNCTDVVFAAGRFLAVFHRAR